MRRLILCSVIFFAVAAGSWGSLRVLKGTTEELCRRIERCAEAHDSESRETAVEALEEYWDSYYSKSSFITRSESLEDMSVSVAVIRHKYGEELAAELRALRERARIIFEEQRPRLSGVL
ncbi:protein of unknown function [Ruminococcus sp. YE71]|uniref:DUF4363 family protein n=1 Tax=unclassified Ruminococcus TaxID=2608920 RepID=UPI00087FABF7|nr:MULTISPECIES: DUF4363 family protein [unclassified Ruminococcus]SDA18962.1 protein of unknown function [Ruminococcus sp. YE78]SFW28924.1 protein of unknown function [Ruminococcus sp. YE71]